MTKIPDGTSQEYHKPIIKLKNLNTKHITGELYEKFWKQYLSSHVIPTGLQIKLIR